ncbi:MAG: hypothetical protein QOK34_1716 [Gaiellaceae bacterium]|jgi:hypothetical protein|nr:hypothetical protein [Gaiellaceae bacterium]MDX6436882.1 hypothetical protein [Gaiellaceae bacterium]
MASRNRWLLLALVGLLAALACSATGQAATGCASALLQDWRDGRIDGTYSVACYRAALDQMPEDVRIYSSAESDIKRALLARIEVAPTTAKAKKVQSTKAKASSSKGGGDGLSPLIVIAIGAALLAAVGSGLALTR